MKQHIVPRTILRGFQINNPNTKANAKIMVLSKDGVKTAKISDAFQAEGFYGKDIEALLNKTFEDPFGKIRNIFVRHAKQKVDTVLLTQEKYFQLICFIQVMWRRNDIHLKRVKVKAESLEKQTGIPFKAKVVDTQAFQENLYKEMISKTTRDDPTVQKTHRHYRPVLLVNETSIAFPLHSKYGSVHYFLERNEQFPSLIIEPMSSTMYLIFVRDTDYNKDAQDPQVIKMHYLQDEAMIKALIFMYIIDHADKYVVDESNIELVKMRIQRDPHYPMDKAAFKRIINLLNIVS